MKVDILLHTDGFGYWSNKVKPVRVISLELSYINEDFTFGELRVYFDTDTWDVDSDGLIYTDNQFLFELLEYIQKFFDVKIDDVSYSEQAMQGDNYVSCDVGEQFLKIWVDYQVNLVHKSQ